MSHSFSGTQPSGTAEGRGQVASGIQSEAVLLEAVASALSFPAYFGRNWDALDECIRDLSWLPSGDVILRHGDLPLAGDRASQLAYLALLADAVAYWTAAGKRRLVVEFPQAAENLVLSALAELNRPT